MAQITGGVRSLLSRPWLYDAFQNALGARRVRRDFSNRYVRARDGDKVLDIGCGTAQMLEFLPSVEYWGYDISGDYVDAANRRYQNRGRFLCKMFDEDELAALPQCDLVLAIGLLHHLDDGEAADLLALVAKALKPHGRLITLDGCFAEKQNPIARCLIAADRGQNVREPAAYDRLAKSAFPHVRGELRHRTWVPYTHWIMECSASSLGPLPR